MLHRLFKGFDRLAVGNVLHRFCVFAVVDAYRKTRDIICGKGLCLSFFMCHIEKQFLRIGMVERFFYLFCRLTGISAVVFFLLLLRFSGLDLLVKVRFCRRYSVFAVHEADLPYVGPDMILFFLRRLQAGPYFDPVCGRIRIDPLEKIQISRGGFLRIDPLRGADCERSPSVRILSFHIDRELVAVSVRIRIPA